MKRFLLPLALALVLAGPARAQQTLGAIDLPTINGSVKITSGLTYQLVLAATPDAPGSFRKSLTIQNNQTSGSDLCYILIGTLNGQVVGGTTATSSNVTVAGATITAAQASIVLPVQGAYTRYFPAVPSDAIYATCTTTSDSLYIDTQ